MLIESKSNLARLMATENLLVEQRQVETAYFDIKNRVLTVPVLNGNLSNELIDLLLGHEVGHALETPEQGWHDSIVDLKVNRSILNVCEDARIEKKIKRKFPGIRISFVKGYRELMEMNFFGVKDKDLNSLNFIDRINLYTKGGAAQGIEFTPEEHSLLNEVENTETFEEVVAVAIKIQKFMKENLQKIEKNAKNKKNKGVGEKENNSDSENVQGELEDGSGDGTEEKVLTIKENDTEEKQGLNNGGLLGNEKIESETDNSFREKEKELYADKKDKDVVYANIPEIELENVIVTYNFLIKEIENTSKSGNWFHPEKMREKFNKFRTESNKVVSHLVKEFEMRKNADQQSRVKISKTGELNLSKIHEYKFTDDIFARLAKVPNGKSHGLVMFIDWSGSMHEHINSTIKQLLNLTMFCRKVNIPFEVYAFSTNTSRERVSISTQKLKVGDLLLCDFSLLNILSSKMSSNEFTKMASYLLDFGSDKRYSLCANMIPPDIMSLSGTPLNEAIISAFKLVPEFKKQNKLQIVNTVFLTDGEGHPITGRLESVSVNDRRYVETTNIVPDWKQRSFFREPVTRSIIEIKKDDVTVSVSQAISLLKLLKQKTDCNIIGFYVANVRSVRSALRSYSTDKKDSKIDSQISEFKKNNFVFLNNVGYDEYYFLRSDKMDTDEDDEFDTNSTTTRGLVNAFSKYTSSRISNRVVLNKFIKMIA